MHRIHINMKIDVSSIKYGDKWNIAKNNRVTDVHYRDFLVVNDI